MRCLWQRTSLCRPVNESARVATVLVHRVILSRLSSTLATDYVIALYSRTDEPGNHFENFHT